MSAGACLLKSSECWSAFQLFKAIRSDESVLKLINSEFFKHGGYYINWMTSQIISREDEANQSRRVCVCARTCVCVRRNQ